MKSDEATDAITADGEPFIPAAAAYLATGESFEVSDDGSRVTIETEDDDGQPVRLTYGLSQIVVSIAQYDNPENADFTTEPGNIERVQAYGDDPNDDPSALTFDRPLGTWNGNDEQAHVEAWDRADYHHSEEDYIHSRGLDDADPVPNSYDVYHVLVKAEVKREGVYVPVWMHDNLTTDDVAFTSDDRFLEDLVTAYLDQQYLEADGEDTDDWAETMIREAELHQLTAAHFALDQLADMATDELAFRVERGDKLAAGDNRDRQYAANIWLAGGGV